jgi:4-azaleucine resistance transporter AzlC
VTGDARRQAFLTGMRDTVPMVVGAIPFGILFGALALTNGLSPAAVMGMSLFVFAGSSQFVAATLVGQGVGVSLIVLTTLVVNLRHGLYAANLGPSFSHLPQRWLGPLAFFLTDETFAVVIHRDGEQADRLHRRWHYLGSATAMYGNWQLCTLIGILGGTRLTGFSDWGLEFAMVATFAGIVVPLIVDRPMLACALVAGGVAVLARDLPHQLGLMVGALAGIVAGVAMDRLTPNAPAASEAVPT